MSLIYAKVHAKYDTVKSILWSHLHHQPGSLVSDRPWATKKHNLRHQPLVVVNLVSPHRPVITIWSKHTSRPSAGSEGISPPPKLCSIHFLLLQFISALLTIVSITRHTADVLKTCDISNNVAYWGEMCYYFSKLLDFLGFLDFCRVCSNITTQNTLFLLHTVAKLWRLTAGYIMMSIGGDKWVNVSES